MLVSSRRFQCRSLFAQNQIFATKNPCLIDSRMGFAALRSFSSDSSDGKQDKLMDSSAKLTQNVSLIPYSPNNALTLDQLQIQVANGDQEAVLKLSYCMYFGKLGLEINKKLALELLARLAKTYPTAMYDLGIFYLRGLDKHEINVPFGTTMIIMAAHKGCPDAMMTCGELYCEGVAVSFDLNKALHWFELAKAAGHESAGRAIEEVKFNLMLQELFKMYNSGCGFSRE